LATRIQPASIVGDVLGSIPPLDRQIHSSDEGDRIVNHDDLLMVGGPGGVLPIQVEMDPSAWPPA
jgi:hypothetical protein